MLKRHLTVFMFTVIAVVFSWAQKPEDKIYPEYDFIRASGNVDSLIQQYASIGDTVGVRFYQLLKLHTAYHQKQIEMKVFLEEFAKLRVQIPANHTDLQYKIDLNTITIAYQEWSEARASEAFKKCQIIEQYAQNTNQKLLQIVCVFTQVNMLFYLKNYGHQTERANLRGKQLAMLFPPYKDHFLMQYHHNQGIIEHSRHSYKKALFHFNQAHHLVSSGKTAGSKALQMLYITQCERFLEDFSSAVDHANQVLQYLKTEPDIEFTRWAYEELGYVYTKQRKYQLATRCWYMYNQAVREIKEKKIGKDLIPKYSDLMLSLVSKEKELLQTQIALNEATQQKTQRTLFLGILIGTLSILVLIFGLIVFRQKATIAQKTLKTEVANAGLKQQKALLEGQEMERKRIAQELHDGIGSLVAAVRMNVLNQKVRAPIIDQLDSLYEQIRSLSHQMYPAGLLKNGLYNTCLDYVNLVNSKQLITLRRFGDEPAELSFEKSLNIFRIVQELINNARSHAQASKILIEFLFDEERLIIKCEDDGIGFETNPNGLKKQGIGLNNIVERTKLLGGELEIVPNVPKGTAIIFSVHLHS